MGEALLTREWVERRLSLAANYWVATVRPDGRPHATPVWGAWVEDAVWFGTSDTSVKGRNLAHRAECVVHTESGDDVVIVEGHAERVGPFDPAAPGDAGRAVAVIAAKYRMPSEEMSTAASDAGLYRVRPREVRAWLEPVFVQTRARWSPW